MDIRAAAADTSKTDGIFSAAGRGLREALAYQYDAFKNMCNVDGAVFAPLEAQLKFVSVAAVAFRSRSAQRVVAAFKQLLSGPVKLAEVLASVEGAVEASGFDSADIEAFQALKLLVLAHQDHFGKLFPVVGIDRAIRLSDATTVGSECGPVSVSVLLCS